VGAPSHRSDYRLLSFRLDEVLRVQFTERSELSLTLQPFYGSIPTTLYGLFWNDLGFFSKPGFSVHMRFPPRRIDPWLASAVIVLGLVPTGLVLLGAAFTLTSRAMHPAYLVVHVFTAIGIATYLWWVFGFPVDEWALKAEYVLFLVGPFAVYFAAGLGVVEDLAPRARTPLRAFLAGFGLLGLAYDLAFAWG
jgi:hypothetical protein